MADKIMNAETYLSLTASMRGDPAVDSANAYHAWVMSNDGARARLQGIDPDSVGLPDDVDGDAAPAIARVYEGSWLADCPDECGGAMFVRPGWPYLCATCFNASIGRRYRRVTFPRQRGAIETVLLERPVVTTRNWFPHETVNDLRAENIEHGDAVPLRTSDGGGA